MKRQNLIAVAAGGSAALLAGAFFFQALGWAPCQMCLWQRWPHAAAILMGALALIAAPFQRALCWLGALAALTTAGIAAYHTGVERKWWEGPSSCTGSGDGLSGLTGNALLPGASDVPALVMCDTFTPFLFGLTMANWNLIASAGLAVVWVMAARAPE